MKSILVIVAVAFLAAAMPAYAEFDVQTNGTHYIITEYENDHLYGGSLTFDGNPATYNTLRLDETNTNKWYPVYTSGFTGDLEYTWYYDTARTQQLASINYYVEPIPEPEPTPEPIPIPTPEPLPTIPNTNSTYPLNGTTTIPIPEPTPIPNHESEATFICHEGVIIQTYGDDLRLHLRHGDQPNVCPEETPEPTPEPEPTPQTATNFSTYSTAQLTVMLGEIFAELLNR